MVYQYALSPYVNASFDFQQKTHLNRLKKKTWIQQFPLHSFI